ncbi:MAG: S1 RNA-binding domain-containing protein [candidate division SR1 bacterium]|nr:S1 RNA-binding domain-containing protein [candidate division SR1 bacterium]
MTEKTSQYTIPVIKEGQKVKGIVLKRIENGVLVDCADGAFTGVILSKEVKELERSGYDLEPGREIELEIVNTNIRHEDGHYIVSITKLLQYDIWKSIIKKFEADEIITVCPTEANLGGLLVDMHGIKGFVPLSQLAPIHYPRVEDGDQEIIFEKLLELIGKDLKVRIINIDEEEKRIVLSEREALKEEREAILADLEVGKIYDGVVSGLSSYGLFVTIGGTVEGLVHISEITYGHVNNIERLGRIGEQMKVKVIGLENGKISLSSKKLKEDPWTVLPREHKIGDILEGEVIRFVPYGVFVRVFDDINGLVHLSELSQKSINNPNEVVKLGQIVKTKIILLDPKNRKIGLSMKGLLEGDTAPETKPTSTPVAPKASAPAGNVEIKEPAKFEGKGLAGIAKKLSKEEITEKAKQMSEKLDKNPDKKDGVVKKTIEKKVVEKEEKAEKKPAAKKTVEKEEKAEKKPAAKKTTKK